jgi:hypothetical protein
MGGGKSKHKSLHNLTFVFGGGERCEMRKNEWCCWTSVVSGSSLLKLGALVAPLDLSGWQWRPGKGKEVVRCAAEHDHIDIEADMDVDTGVDQKFKANQEQE